MMTDQCLQMVSIHWCQGVILSGTAGCVLSSPPSFRPCLAMGAIDKTGGRRLRIWVIRELGGNRLESPFIRLI